ncbi:MAG: CocE/NonD family hydrolase [Paracoccaceae bacterium]|nr:CocE/NonD family hydrolase [Paracoccaceae bacterium]
MKTVNKFPRETEILDPVFINMSDGVRLAAKIWLPKDATSDPVPAILEYLPYRRGDGTSGRDATTHPYFAGHGYASIRVDMRGSGDSEGVMLGEYLKQEQDDALEVIDWIARQPWCTGKVGMIGISWGGFNGLQVAARRPEPLKAIVSICSTDDRYADDIHYMGGCMMMDNPGWNSHMFSINTTPPDPLMVGNKWKEIWMDRLKGSGFWIEEWLQHQRRDDFWKHGSVCENFDDIEAAVYAVGGWADGYSNAVFRLLAGLKSPCKGLVGPWAHKYPHFARPGPQIGFLQECLRWWDHWLKGADTGIMDEPQLRAWIEDPVPPQTYYEERPGKWVAEASWPSARIAMQVFHLTSRGLQADKGAAEQITINSPTTVGMMSGSWCAYGLDPDLPGDQRMEAGGSLVFDTEPLAEDIEILGAPILSLQVASDKPVAMVAGVLSDLLPDGTGTRVSYGLLNLTHRDSHETPEPLEPGKSYAVTLQLNDAGHRFSAGNRIRIALSTAYWPTTWPTPEKVTLTLTAGDSSISLPVRPANATDADLRPFEEAEGSGPLNATVQVPPNYENAFSIDMTTGVVSHRTFSDEGTLTYDDHDGWTVTSSHEEIERIHPDNPLSAELDITWNENFSRGAWEVSTKTRTTMRSTVSHFIIRGELEAHMGDELVHSQTWESEVPRDLV